ncbi:MAG: hypothetical protein WCR67_07515, partial [Bacilli bacterium]
MNSKYSFLVVISLLAGLTSCGTKVSSSSPASSSSSSNEISSSEKVSSSTTTSSSPKNPVSDNKPFTVDSTMLDQTNTDTLGLSKITNAKTVHVFEASDDTNHYLNGVLTTYFKGKFYCQWQSSIQDEDAIDTYVAYATSTDGETWNAPTTLVPTIDDGY